MPEQQQQDRIVKSPVKARQGFLDRPVLAVLAASVALLIILYGALFAGFFAS